MLCPSRPFMLGWRSASCTGSTTQVVEHQPPFWPARFVPLQMATCLEHHSSLCNSVPAQPHRRLTVPGVTLWLSLFSLNVLVPGHLCPDSFCVFCWGIFSVSCYLVINSFSLFLSQLERQVCRHLPWTPIPRKRILSEHTIVSLSIHQMISRVIF